MGKLQNASKPPVQREKGSHSGGLEVISQESFVERLQGMSSACRNCERERLYSSPGRKGKSGRRKQYTKSKAPVPSILNDRIRSGCVKRQSSMDGDSDISARSADEDQYTSSSSSDSGLGALHHVFRANRKSNLDYLFTSVYGDVASIPEFVPKSNNYFYQAWPHPAVSQAFPGMFPHSTVSHRSPSYSYSDAQLNKKTDQKNLSGLISVIEKAHKKELPDIEANLSRDFTEDAKLGCVLNNVSATPQHMDPELKRRNMAECENVELICNDLSNSSGKLAESSDESDASDKASVVSSCDTLSDDVNDLAVVDESNEHEFTSEELNQLAEYTTGVPLIRYDHPQRSDHISGYYTYQYFPYDTLCHKSQPKEQHQLSSIKTTPSARTSTSSESDLLSDVEDGSVVSSSSSRSSSSSPSSSCSSHAPGSVDNTFPTTDTNAPWDQPANTLQGINKLKPIKRATVSVKRVHSSCNEVLPADLNFNDSVYMDLTDLDVSISVMYHTETAVWPYSDHYSPHQALYWPASTALTTGIRLPLRFNNQMLHPDFLSAHALQKFEMSMPPHRPWILTDTADAEIPSAMFSVMCYNVLCDKLCTKAMYAYCPTWALSWDYRKKGIMSDIRRCNADIITLQEVETEQYYSMFLPELAQQGYDGIFLPKSRVRTMNSDKDKKSVDGCAIFFRKSKFEKVIEYHVEFSRLATRDGHSNTDTDMINRVSTKDNIAIVAVLRTRPGAYAESPVTPPKGLSQLLMVSTAHIHWDPQFPDVKLVQTMMLIEELQRFVKEISQKFRPNTPPFFHGGDTSSSIPLILCGDFNSLPDSGVYEYLSKGKLDTNHKDFEGQNYPAFMKGRNFNGSLTHKFQLASAYKDVIPFTNYTFDFKGIIDYIFYSENSLRLLGVMGLQDEEWFRANKIVGCPHPFVPSDHFPLFAEFSLPVSSRPKQPR